MPATRAVPLVVASMTTVRFVHTEQIEATIYPTPAPSAISILGPGRAQWTSVDTPLAHTVLYVCGGRATDDDVRTVKELSAEGVQVAVDSSDGRWLDEIPASAAWIRLHRSNECVLAEVVHDAEAGIEHPVWIDGVLGAVGALSVHVLAMSGLVGDRLRHPMMNEATLLVEEGLAGPDAIDEALRLGMGHDQGPFEVLEELGAPYVRDSLLAMALATGDPRYRPSSLLKRWAAKAERGVHHE